MFCSLFFKNVYFSEIIIEIEIIVISVLTDYARRNRFLDTGIFLI